MILLQDGYEQVKKGWIGFSLAICRKSLFSIMFTIGIWVIKPLAIYSFLLIIQTLWQIPDKITNVQEEKAKVEEETEKSRSKKSTVKRGKKKK